MNRGLIKNWYEMGSPGRTETAQVHPFHFTTSIADLAKEAGVEIRTNSKVTRIVVLNNRVQGLEYLDRTTNESKEMRDVTDIVVTAGPWTSSLLPRAKIEGLRAHSVVI